MRVLKYYIILLCLSSCILVIHDKDNKVSLSSTDSSKAYRIRKDSAIVIPEKDSMNAAVLPPQYLDTKNVNPRQLVEFAKTLIGTPYKYGSIDPSAGFDCSGFITYVFHHFNIIVPRSSIDFVTVGKDVAIERSKAGDLILFTGTDSTERFVGHIGLIVSNNADGVQFIHSTSGRQYGVTITPLNVYYRSRYMKTIRVFNQND